LDDLDDFEDVLDAPEEGGGAGVARCGCVGASAAAGENRRRKQRRRRRRRQQRRRQRRRGGVRRTPTGGAGRAFTRTSLYVFTRDLILYDIRARGFRMEYSLDALTLFWDFLPI
jgi:hypothetical protein